MQKFVSSIQSSHRLAQLSAVAVGVLLAGGTAFAASTIEQKCQDAVTKAGAKYFSSIAKAVSKCEVGRSSGDIPELTNCRPSVGIIGDAKTASAVLKANTKLEGDINKNVPERTSG